MYRNADVERKRRIGHSLTMIWHEEVDRSKIQCPMCWEYLLWPRANYVSSPRPDCVNGIPKEACKIDETEREIPVRLRCGHIFGRVCITKWLLSNDTCPLCRAKVLVIRLIDKKKNIDWNV